MNADIARRLRALIAGGGGTRDRAGAMSAVNRGPKPFDPAVNSPRDAGLGGVSTEYLVGGEDPHGTPYNYPSVWWLGDEPVVMPPDDAMRHSDRYEAATGRLFPRYVSNGAAEFAARNRSALGGAEKRGLAGTFPYGNF